MAFVLNAQLFTGECEEPLKDEIASLTVQVTVA
jgi:hypothetical protein